MQAGGDDYIEFVIGTDVKDTGIRLRDVMSDTLR
jgi:predicted RNA-binding protein